MKVTLAFPPQWTAAQPSTAMASLNGELRRGGHQVTVEDLNLEFFHYLMDPRTIRLSSLRLKSEIASLTAEVKLRIVTDDLSDRLAIAGRKLELLEEFQAGPGSRTEALTLRVEDALAIMRGDRFYEPREYIRAMATLDEAFKLFSTPFFPAEVRWNDFSSPLPYNFDPMLAFCREPLGNPFHRFYDVHVRRILDAQPDLVCLSVGSFSQVLPGLTLAHLLRQAMDKRRAQGTPVPTLCLGGNFFSRLLEPLRQRPAFFDEFCDVLVMGEGELPLASLAHALETKGSLGDVPNLLHLEGGEVLWTGESPPRKMAEAAWLDLRGFPTQRYLSPELVLCIAASKGCYYGECAFCDSHYGLTEDSVEVDQLVAHIRHLRDAHGVRHFEFIDQCIEPPYMDAMCDAFIREKLDVHWFCNARTEAGFTPELLRKMKQAGATMVMWGVECASARLLKLMRKGVSTRERMNILKASADAGLWNFAYIFFGFPTETEEEANDTIQMLVDHADIIHSYGRSVFTLGKHSPLFEQKEDFGILGYVEDVQEFSTNLTYRTTNGLQAQDLNRISARCKDAYRAAHGDPTWMAVRSRENLHLYLARHGAAWVARHRLDAAQEKAPGAQPEFVF